MTAEDGAESSSVPVSPLPESVRREIVAYAAEALGTLPPEQVPPSLRRIRSFTPSKRARLGAAALAAAVVDPGFRALVHEYLLKEHPDLVSAVQSGEAASMLPLAPARAAAVGYLAGTASWPALVVAAAGEEQRHAVQEAQEELTAETERLREQLKVARAAAHRAHVEGERQRAGLHEQVEGLRARVRQSGERLKRAEAAAESARADVERLRHEAADTATESATEARRLRSRIGQLEAAVEAARRGVRERRAIDDVRLGMLLDQLTSAAAGIRRELALPPVQGSPADAVAAALEAGTAGPLARIGVGLSAQDDPALLDRALALSGLHLVVDGYNVTKTGFAGLSLEAQRNRLLARLGALAARYPSAEVTCVFDGAEARERPKGVPTPRGVRVLFSKVGEIADTVIVSLVAQEPAGRPVLVISSDREVAEAVRSRGATPMASTVLLAWLGRG